MVLLSACKLVDWRVLRRKQVSSGNKSGRCEAKETGSVCIYNVAKRHGDITFACRRLLFSAVPTMSSGGTCWA